MTVTSFIEPYLIFPQHISSLSLLRHTTLNQGPKILSLRPVTLTSMEPYFPWSLEAVYVSAQHFINFAVSGRHTAWCVVWGFTKNRVIPPALHFCFALFLCCFWNWESGRVESKTFSVPVTGKGRCLSHLAFYSRVPAHRGVEPALRLESSYLVCDSVPLGSLLGTRW